MGGLTATVGARTIGWSGHLLGDGFAVQGNRLAGRETLEAAGEAVISPGSPTVRLTPRRGGGSVPAVQQQRFLYGHRTPVAVALV